MTTTLDRPVTPGPAAAPSPTTGDPHRLDTLGDVAKFAAAVALLAILADAVVGHALLWENDPYWTYWITKTFLIATVFGLGTAWFGIGAGRGAALTAVQVLVLTVYYWSLAPIGLPSHPDWLDLQHTWVTGIPVHFGVIYLGYLTALWVWRRRARVVAATDHPSVAADAGWALALAAGVVVAGGLLDAAALGEFQGVTWYVVRLLIAVPFVLAWWAATGREPAAAAAGGVVLALVLATYSHFLGPVGLPSTNLRILAQDPPPAPVHWLTYRQEFLVMLPILALVAVAGFVGVSVARGHTAGTRPSPATLVGVAAAVLGVVALGAVAAKETAPGKEVAKVSSAGGSSVERGPYFRGTQTAAAADLRLTAEDRNPRVTPLPPHDRVHLHATIRHPDGTDYTVTATTPLVDDPKGRFTTWWGVGEDVWNHGRSGIGSSLVPITRSELAVYALGDVRQAGRVVAAGVPVHVMTMDNTMGRLELDVGDPSTPVPGLPDGHLRVVWDGRTGGVPHAGAYARDALGGAVLIALLVLAGVAVHGEERVLRR
ncbi:MAG TPA: hypothetical protein VFJ85_05555 [Acidimicrobiales bacterium]|nr:hypothetical protein [Acidimicrobiales bacterium]